MLRMRQVLSTQSEQESRSYDESDEREPEFYQKNMFVVKEDADISEAYFIDREEVPFGFEFFRKITLREVNFGEKVAAGPQFTVAGRSLFDKPFEICNACGKVKKNGKIDHAVYCRYWGRENLERVIEACFLYREFSSEAIRMLLPIASFDVDRNIHSFVAALNLGLKRKFRGDPVHLHTTITDEPVPGSDVRKRYLVLYDSVPGGTGYLKELMRDEKILLEVFERAHETLKNCSCQKDPEKDGCYRCLLAYRGRHHQQNTSRQAAIELLRLILDNRQHLKRTKRLDAIRLNSLLESELEGRFIEALRRTEEGEPLRKITHQIVNGKEGFYLRSEPGNYLIEPQVELGLAQGVPLPSRADFVLYPERPVEGELPIAVFTDGYEYHADPLAGPRLGIDTAQRMALMGSGRYRIWSLTWDDVQDQFRYPVPSFKTVGIRPGMRMGALLNAMDPSNANNWHKIEGLSSFGILMMLIGAGRKWKWDQYGKAFVTSLLTSDVGKPGRLRLSSQHLYPGGAKLVCVDGGMEAEALQKRDFSRLELRAQLFDDNPGSDLGSWKTGWREFLRLGNLLQFIGVMEYVTSLGLADDLYLPVRQTASLIPDKTGERGSFYDLVALELRELCRRIAAAGKALPEPGFELTNEEGEIIAAAELAWPAVRIAVLTQHEADGSSQFRAAGWRVFEAAPVIAEPDMLVQLLPHEATQ